jgi:hypothetical protein
VGTDAVALPKAKDKVSVLVSMANRRCALVGWELGVNAGMAVIIGHAQRHNGP